MYFHLSFHCLMILTSIIDHWSMCDTPLHVSGHRGIICLKIMFREYSALAFRMAWSYAAVITGLGAVCLLVGTALPSAQPPQSKGYYNSPGATILVNSTESKVECEGTNHWPRARWRAEMVPEPVHPTLLFCKVILDSMVKVFNFTRM